MAKEVESCSEPSQSSSALPPLAENEVELVIERFWRDTRPRVCVRSETKMVNGFNFRLLVWPQGSKQSQSHLSAFVEVVAPTTPEGKKDSDDTSSLSKQYPPDWACPCVFYRISVMNFKQKYPYSKADTWTFSYVCPDRGWHTLLDTRYINRRDGYLSNEGSLVIRAIAFPRFGHSISVLPLLSNISHSEDVSSSSSSSAAVHFGLSNFLATDHLNCFIQTLYHIPGFRKFLYSLRHKSSPAQARQPLATLDAVELETIEQGLKSCSETIKEIMTRVTSAAPDVSRLIQNEFFNDCQDAGLCVCGNCEESSKTLNLARQYGRCRVLINCLEESLYSVSQSLFGRKRSMSSDIVSKRVQFDAYRHIVRDCKRILATVGHNLFVVEMANPRQYRANLAEELQLIFAKLEYGESVSSNEQKLIDTRGLIRELGFTSGGLASGASPDGIFIVMLEGLKKCVSEMMWTDSVRSESPSEALLSLIEGMSIRRSQSPETAEEAMTLTHLRFVNGKATTIDKHVAAWVSGSGSETCQVGTIPETPLAQFTKLPKILNMQFLNKVKDRLDVSERIGLGQYFAGSTEEGSNDPELALPNEKPLAPHPIAWDIFLDHVCSASEGAQTVTPVATARVTWQYRLHSITFCSGDYAGGHYSVIVRNHRMGGWTRFDDAWKEDLIDVCGAATSQNPSGTVTSNPDWVFSPEWSCSSVSYVREDSIDELYSRGVDVRLIRPDLFTRAVNYMETSDLSVGSSILCNRTCPLIPIPATPDATKLDPTCQVEISLITEKDVLGSCPGGFSVPFSFVVPNATRKLIVRKDIPVERLMKAVAEHFKIPVQLQRLFALRYYPETVQERFELMQTHRSILAYLPIDAAPGKESGLGKSVSNRTIVTSSSLYVLVSGRRSMTTTEVTVWVKVFDEKSMGLISVCLLSVDPAKCLKDYSDQVTAKVTSNAALKAGGLLTGIESDTQYIVFEEIGPRIVELRRTTAPIKNEKIFDGDVLILVPLTDNAKRSLIGSAAGLGNMAQGARPKRRVHQLLNASAVETEPRDIVEEVLSEREFSSSCDSDGSIYSDSEVEELDSAIDLNERCRRFLTRAGKASEADDDALIDEAYEEMILGELMREEEEASECQEPGCVCTCQDSRLDAIRRLIRGTGSDESTGKRLKKTRRNPATGSSTQRPKLANIMSEIMKEFDSGRPADAAGPLNLFDGMTKDELGKLINRKPELTKRLDVPSELKDELSRIPPCPLCFYCQLPLTCAAKAAGPSIPPAKVSCSAKCVDHPLVYHDRCVQDLVRETATDACVITEGCSGKVIVEPKTVISGLITKKEIKLSTASLRSKLGSVLAMPPVPCVGKGGQITPPIKVWSGKGQAPSLPSGIKLNPAVKKGAKKGAPSLPTESLWWNACLVAFGGQENLQLVIVDKQWDAADLVQAKAVFLHWCKVLLEKQVGKKTPAPVGSRAVSYATDASALNAVVESSSSSEETSSSSEDDCSDNSENEVEDSTAPVAESVITLESETFAAFADESGDDDDDGFILVGTGASGRKNRRPESDLSNVHTPTSAALSTTHTSAANSPNIIQVVIPQGFLGQPVTKDHEEERADKAAASIAEQAVSSLLYADLVDFEEVEPSTDLYTPPTPSPAISLVDTLSASISLLESRMNLLPISVRQYCLPVELVFVYYSVQFFGDKQAKTVSLIPSAGLSQEEIFDSITLAAFNLSAVISRIFTSPHQTISDSRPAVQWFVEFETPSESLRFTEWVTSACPEWAPESGALLPASMLGFAV